jgi:lysozyme
MRFTWSATSLLGLCLLACAGPGTEPELCFATSREPLRVCAAGATVPGIDVSYYQSTVNWPQVKDGGVTFAIARVSYGTGTIDSQFAANWAGIRAQGLVRGTYQFFRPSQDPQAQADVVIAQLQAAGGYRADDLPVVMDIEVTESQTPATIQQKMQVWLDAIEAATGKKPVIYTGNNMTASLGNGFVTYPLWVANYGVSCPLMPSTWTQWQFWQSSGSGAAQGVSGAVDLDEWNGTLPELEAWAGFSADAGVVTPPDAGVHDAGTAPDAGSPDAGTHDAGTLDAGVAHDAGVPTDAGSTLPPDAGVPIVDGGEGYVMGDGRLFLPPQCP